MRLLSELKSGGSGPSSHWSSPNKIATSVGGGGAARRTRRQMHRGTNPHTEHSFSLGLELAALACFNHRINSIRALKCTTLQLCPGHCERRAPGERRAATMRSFTALGLFDVFVAVVIVLSILSIDSRGENKLQ